MKHSLNLLLMVFLIGILPSCWWRKKATCKNHYPATVNLPLSANKSTVATNDNVNSFFEADGENFDSLPQIITGETPDMVVSHDTVAVNDDFSWINAAPTEANEFKTVYFDFDDYTVRADQKPLVVKDAQVAAKQVNSTDKKSIVVEGHACHSAGSAAYNIALSEKRAKAIAKELIAQGVEKDTITTVGRGSEMAAVVNGKPVGGTREQQWPNRRVELHVVNR